MEQLTDEIRRLVYTVICFQCIVQFAAGSAYQRYLKLFTYFLAICMCCGVISSFMGELDASMLSAQRLYDEWTNEWQNLLDIDRINEGSYYYTDKIWNEKIMQESYEMGSEGGEDNKPDSQSTEE